MLIGVGENANDGARRGRLGDPIDNTAGLDEREQNLAQGIARSPCCRNSRRTCAHGLTEGIKERLRRLARTAKNRARNLLDRCCLCCGTSPTHPFVWTSSFRFTSLPFLRPFQNYLIFLSLECLRLLLR